MAISVKRILTFRGKMTDVDTLQSQLFPTPLINKPPYDGVGFDTDSYLHSPAGCCGLMSFKNLTPKAPLSDQIQCLVLDFFCHN